MEELSGEGSVPTLASAECRSAFSVVREGRYCESLRFDTVILNSNLHGRRQFPDENRDLECWRFRSFDPGARPVVSRTCLSSGIRLDRIRFPDVVSHFGDTEALNLLSPVCEPDVRVDYYGGVLLFA